jgi:molybdenum cofactor biosynthesis protein B
MSESTKKHKAQAPARLRFSIFTVSTSRYHQSKRGQKVDDVSGDLIESSLRNSGHDIALRRLIPDDHILIEKNFKQALTSPELDAAIFCGGTGIAPSDVTIETVTPLLQKVLPGFGEIFRRLSFDEIGSGAVLSRAIAGVVNGKAVFCVPGSPNAVKLCMEKLILPESPHIVKHARESSRALV